MKMIGTIVCCLLLPLLSACSLKEVRSKTKLGPEYRHKGSNATDAVRWTAQQGLEFKWDKGISTGITYRRRDVDKGDGSNDNGIWLEFSFPLFKAKQKSVTSERIEMLERRLARLETEMAKAEQMRLAGRRNP